MVVNEAAIPGAPWLQDILGVGIPVVLLASPEHAPAYLALADQHCLFVATATQQDESSLWVTLAGAHAAFTRELRLKGHVERLEQRLNDRIIIERAKGILIQCLGISEEEAYQRLRVLSRQQQRRMRDVAQSLLNSRTLFVPKVNPFSVPMDEGNHGDSPEDLPAALGAAARAAWPVCKKSNRVSAVGGGSDYAPG
jgi:hypothetical protein